MEVIQQIKTFTMEAGSAGGSIGSVIDGKVNPILATLQNAKVICATVDMAGSWHKATVIISYEITEDAEDVTNSAPEEANEEHIKKRTYTRRQTIK